MSVRTALALAGLLLAAAPATAAAEPSGNDSPAGATPILALPANVPGRTAEATMAHDEPAPLIAAEGGQRGLDRSVWFSYMPERDRSILADTCDANFENHIDVYTGAPDTLTPIPTTSDDYSGCAGERRTFTLAAGVAASIRVTALRSPERVPDGGVFHLSLTAQEPPGNDAFTSAVQLPGTGSFAASLAFSTIEFGEPSGGSDTGSVWFRLPAPRSEPYTIQLGANPFGANVTAFEAVGGTINALRRLGIGYSNPTAPGSVSFNTLGGHRYYLRVATSAAVGGEVRMDVTTNTARGIGLLVTPARNTLRSIRRSGFRAVLSCARTCTLGVDLEISAREARRLKLVDKDAKLGRSLRVGHVGGALQTGRATTVSVPIGARRVRQALAHARSVRFTLVVTVRGGTRAQAVRRTVTVRR